MSCVKYKPVFRFNSPFHCMGFVFHVRILFQTTDRFNSEFHRTSFDFYVRILYHTTTDNFKTLNQCQKCIKNNLDSNILLKIVNIHMCFRLMTAPTFVQLAVPLYEFRFSCSNIISHNR